jgi:hypothetical protein
MNTLGIINEAYNELTAATINHFAAVQEETQLDAAVKQNVAKALFDGTISGGNQQTRDAAARKMFEDEYAALETAQQRTRERRLELDLANIEVERVRIVQRFMGIGQ